MGRNRHKTREQDQRIELEILRLGQCSVSRVWPPMPGQPHTVADTPSVTSALQRTVDASPDWLSRRLLSPLPAIVCALSPDGTTLYVNDVVTRITGYRPDELRGRNWWDVFRRRDQPGQIRDLCLEARSGDVADREIVVTAKDGSLKTLVWNSSAYYQPDGRLTRIVGVAVGIPASHRVRDVLPDGHELFRSAALAATDAIVAMDSLGAVVFWNPAATAMFGYTDAEMISRPLTLLMPERFQRHHLKALDRTRSIGELRLGGKTVEYTGLR